MNARPDRSVPFTGSQVGALIAMVEAGTLSRNLAKDVFEEMSESGGDPAAIVERLGLVEISDPDALLPIVERLLVEHPDKVEGYRSGRHGLLGFFVGAVMRETQGRGNPGVVKELVSARLTEGGSTADP